VHNPVALGARNCLAGGFSRTSHIGVILTIYLNYVRIVFRCVWMSVNNKRAKFVELAENRVNRAIKDLQLIGNLSNRSAYEFTDTDVRKIFGALQRALDGAKARFSKQSEGSGGEFRL